MGPEGFPATGRRAGGMVLAVLVSLTATACAGEVGKYRNALPRSGATNGVPTTGPAAGADSPAGPVGATPVVPDADAGLPGSTATVPSSGAVTGRRSVHSATAAAAASGPLAGSTSNPVTGPAPPATAAGTGPKGSGTADGTPSAPGAPPPVPSAGNTTGVTRDTLAIGLFYPKTGAYAGILRNLPVVIQAAFDEAGPINGRRLVLKTYDDGTASASTIQVEEKRARDESFALLSGVGETNVVLAPLADQHRVPLVVANIDEQVALPLTYVFAVTAYWRRQATILPGFIRSELGGGAKRIGVVFEGTSTAKNAKDAFKAKAAAEGLNVVFEQPIAQNQSTCANEVSNLQSHRVEVAVLINGPLGGICMLRDGRALNYHPTWTGVGASWNFNAVATASGGGADGVRMLTTQTTLETPAGRRYVAFARKYLSTAGAEDDDLMLLAYGFTQTVIEGLRRTGPNLTREAFVQTFETRMNGFDSGYLPPPTFGPGDRSGPVVVGVTACCTDGKWTTPQLGWRATF